MTGSSSSSSAESPASLILNTVVECPQQLPVDAAKAAVRHQDDHIAVAVLAYDRRDDLVVVGDVACAGAGLPQVRDKPLGVESLCFRQRGSEDSRQDDFVG